MMEQKPNRKVNPGTHSMLLAVAGGYLLYIAFQLFQQRDASGLSPVLSILIVVFFAIAGGVVLVQALRQWRKSQQVQADETAQANAVEATLAANEATADAGETVTSAPESATAATDESSEPDAAEPAADAGDSESNAPESEQSPSLSQESHRE